MEMFKEATRLKLRWEFRGLVSVEDLWDLTAVTLDAMFQKLNVEKSTMGGESLLADTSEDKPLILRIEIIRHIVAVKLAEQTAEKDKVLKAARKQKLLGMIEEKQDGVLRDMPIDELQSLVDSL